VFSGARYSEEGGAGVSHEQLAVGLDAVPHAVYLPEGVAYLDSGLVSGN
jgi:hypothetical protein